MSVGGGEMSKDEMSKVGKCYNLPRTFFILKGAVPPSPTPLEFYSVAAGMSEVLQFYNTRRSFPRKRESRARQF